MANPNKYQRHEVLGTNKDGSTAKRGPRTIHKTTEPISHFSHGMGQHVTGHAGNNIATDGAPKRVHAIEVHSSQHRTAGTNKGASVTSSVIDDEKMEINPVVSGGKLGKPVPPTLGQRSRTQASEVTPCAPGVAHTVSAFGAGALHDARHANASKILNEGVMAARDPNHPAHPANLRRR